MISMRNTKRNTVRTSTAILQKHILLHGLSIDALKNIVDGGGEISRESIQQELKEIKIEGQFSNGNEIILPYDTIAFEEDEFNGTPYLNQNLNATLTVTQIEDGVYVPIWPYDIAQADVVYPATYE